jgi:two-component system CheB/CheR fusion protein
LPPDSGAGFVLVPHLDPGHASMLPDLLKKYTKMNVVQAEDGVKVGPNVVYVIPPNTDMVIMHGTLLFKKPAQARGLRLPIDTFFRSLAEDQKDRAIGIILSGNGTDGTLGLKAIKAELGMTMAQDPATAEYESMPRSAVQSGIVDHVSAPDKLAGELAMYLKHVTARRTPIAISRLPQEPESLQKIFHLMRAKTGHDFSLYKRNTLCRRIERRMAVH